MPKKLPKRHPKVDWISSGSLNTRKSETSRKPQYLLFFQHVRPQILLAFPYANPPKNTPQNRHCKLVTPNLKKTSRLIKIDSQMNPQIHQKSMKIQPWTPRCPLRCPRGPMDHQDGDPRAKIKPPRYQNGASRSPKLQFLIKQIADLSKGWPGAGAKP